MSSGLNWFSLVQSLGIIGGLLFTAVSLREVTKARQIENLLRLTERHSDLWTQVLRRSRLSRILSPSVNLSRYPITAEENIFVNLLIVHLGTAIEFQTQGMISGKVVVKEDIQWFFSLPIPQDVWKKTTSLRNPELVAYVQKCLLEKKGDTPFKDASGVSEK